MLQPALLLLSAAMLSRVTGSHKERLWQLFSLLCLQSPLPSSSYWQWQSRHKYIYRHSVTCRCSVICIARCMPCSSVLYSISLCIPFTLGAVLLPTKVWVPYTTSCRCCHAVRKLHLEVHSLTAVCNYIVCCAEVKSLNCNVPDRTYILDLLPTACLE